ncbi:unnamed protein product [Owenia fusiformis]|uniref:Uncharacterized protein n=1 Tax=Owenia fusiformis TaxID=6347 RepID=A0A8J1TS08_OWEFU|nr:unnamed protein product [Owenia fusiformis]
MLPLERTFSPWDYVVFGVMLAISAGIGLFYAFTGGKQKTQKEYLMANRNMSTLPVAISICVSFLSAILILGTPAEMYRRGTMYWLNAFGICIAIIFAAVSFVPLLYPLKLTSSYEYLQLRFKSHAAKLTGTLILIVSQLLYMGIVLFSPSTALEAVTGIPTWVTVVVNGAVSTFYTFLGGMKAVVWTDVFQFVVMIGGLLAIVIKGTIEVGGIERVWEINQQSDRIEFFDFNTDPTQRHTFWGLIVGTTIGWLSTYGVNQASVQRYSSLPSKNKARVAILLNIPGILFLITICCVAGIVCFAYYQDKGCDPLKAGFVDNSNQLIPYFVMEVLDYPGLPGLFISCLFSGSLSTMSSTLNALSAITWEDMLKWKFDHIPESRKTLINKLMVLIYGAAGIGMAFLAQNLGGTVLQASLSFTGAAGGPLIGIFILGAVFPWANWIGVVVGGLVGLALPLWISFGAYFKKPFSPFKPTTILNCTYNSTVNMTYLQLGLPDIPDPTAGSPLTGIDSLYTVSYLWYPSIGAATAIILGLIVSCLTGFMSSDEVDAKYIMPIFDWIFCCIPRKSKNVLHCGLNQADRDEEIENWLKGREGDEADVSGVENGAFESEKSMKLERLPRTPSTTFDSNGIPVIEDIYHTVETKNNNSVPYPDYNNKGNFDQGAVYATSLAVNGDEMYPSAKKRNIANDGREQLPNNVKKGRESVMI